MARNGQHKQAQAYAKNWGRKMRLNADSEEQRMVHKEFVSNLNNLQQCMAKQDMMEKKFMEDDEMGEEEEQKEPEKKGIFAKLFNSGKS
jgi:ribosomal protein L14E/L6E/L27E